LLNALSTLRNAARSHKAAVDALHTGHCRA
jgi:hypothetical protein